MTSNKEQGKTYPDIISENVKWILIALGILIIIFICLIVFKVPFKIGNIEFGDRKTVLHDTIIKSKTDTQYIEKSPIIIKSTPALRQLSNTEKNVSVKSNDTIIAVQNQPANINTGTNNGIIGNNNSIKVEEKQRTLSQTDKTKILFEIESLRSANNSKTKCLDFIVTANDKEAYKYSNEIATFLYSKGFIISGMAQAHFAPPQFGLNIKFDEKTDCVNIIIGLND